MSGVNQLTYYPFVNAVGPLVTSSKTALFDVIRGLSIMNAKNYEYTDRSGNMQGVLCDITLTCNVPIEAKLVAIPNSWKSRNATRKFHFERDDMFARAGITESEMGKYGKTIRPYFDLCHAEDEGLSTQFAYWMVNPMIVTTGEECEDPYRMRPATGGEWTRTRLTAADPSPLVVAGTVQNADEWTIHVCDEHDFSGPPWESVGMIQAYNEDRMEVVTPDADETITANNPLALLSSQTVTGGQAADIAEEQELEATPYDIADGGDSIRKIQIADVRTVPYSDVATSKVYQQTTTLRNVFLPFGYVAMEFDKILYQGNPEDYLSVEFDVHGVLDCKDWIEA